MLCLLVDRLDERKHRKDFILKRNLLYPNLFEKNLSPEEELYQRFKVYTRYHPKEEHEEMMRSIILEHHIIKRIQVLQVEKLVYTLKFHSIALTYIVSATFGKLSGIL